MNSLEINKQVALAWIDAFNNKDLDKLLSLYKADAIHYSPKLKARQPETKGQISGKPALRAWWSDAFNRLPTLHYQLINLVVGEQQMVIEYCRRVDGEPDMMVAEILELDHCLIAFSRVYHG